MIQWWMNACISRNNWTIPVQECCRASHFFREVLHTQTALAPWPSSHISVQAGYVCDGISESNSRVWKLTFPEGILCFSAVVGPGDFLLPFPSLGCGCSTCKEMHAQISTDMGPLGTGDTFWHFSSPKDIHQPGSVSMSTQGCAGGCMVAALIPVIWLSPFSELPFWSCCRNIDTGVCRQARSALKPVYSWLLGLFCWKKQLIFLVKAQWQDHKK